MAGDTISVATDEQAGEPLIHEVMRGGKRLGPPPSLDEIRAHAAHELERLPQPLRELEPDATYEVQIGNALKDLAAEFDHHLLEQDRKP